MVDSNSSNLINRHPTLFFGLYLGFIIAGIIWIGLLVVCPPPADNKYSISITDSVTPDLAKTILANALANCHRHLGRSGVDLFWGYNPQPNWLQPTKIPFGLNLVPILIGGTITLAYIGMMRCRDIWLLTRYARQ